MKDRSTIIDSKKLITHLNMEKWMLDFVDKLASNRSSFFRSLFIEMINGVPDILNYSSLSQTEDKSIGEICLAYYWQDDFDLIRKVSKYYCKGMPIYMKKKRVSIFIDEWILETIDQTDYNRSFYFSNLLKSKIKIDLLKSGFIKKETIITKAHGDIYINEFLKCS